MKNQITKCKVLLCTFILTSVSLFAADYEEYPITDAAFERSTNQIDKLATDLPDIGKLQGNMEGNTGEGDSFFLLDFKTNGTVTIKKQFSGKNLSEEKTWKLNGTAIEIIGKAESEIGDFGGKQLKYVERESFTYPRNVWVAFCVLILLFLTSVAMAMQPKKGFIRPQKPSFSVPNINSRRVHKVS